MHVTLATLTGQMREEFNFIPNGASLRSSFTVRDGEYLLFRLEGRTLTFKFRANCSVGIVGKSSLAANQQITLKEEETLEIRVGSSTVRLLIKHLPDTGSEIDVEAMFADLKKHQ